MKEPTLYEGDHGHAVAVAQRRLCAEHVAVKVDGVFGPATLEAVVRFQREHHLKVDGIVGPQTWKALGIAPVITIGALTSPADYALWYLRLQQAHHCLSYQERRPMVLVRPPAWPPYMDCSTFVTLCYRDAGWPDPNGLRYDGYGYTGTLADHGVRVHLSQMAASDLVFYSDPDHVTIAVGDGRVVSMGQPGEPVERSYDYRPVAQVRSYPR